MVGRFFGSSHSRSKNKSTPTATGGSTIATSTRISDGDGGSNSTSNGNTYVPPDTHMSAYVEVDTDLNNVNIQEPVSNLVASRSRLFTILRRCSSADDVRNVETAPTSNLMMRHSNSQNSQVSSRLQNLDAIRESYSSHSNRTPSFIQRMPQCTRVISHQSQSSRSTQETPHRAGGQGSISTALVKDAFRVDQGDSYDDTVFNNISGESGRGLTANDLAAGQLLRWKMEAEEGPIIIQILAFALAVGCIVTTLYPIVSDNTYWNSSTIIGAFHTINLCAIILIFELRDPSLNRRSLFNVRAKVRALASRYFNILRLIWGRGLLYIFAGSMNYSIGHPYCIYTSCGLMGTGVLAIIFGSRASFNLDRLRASVTDEVYLWTKFDAVDDDTDEHIDIDGFANLVWSLGLQVSDTYTFRAFSQIDRDADGLISFEEFQSWWFDGKEQSKKWWIKQTR